MYQDKKSKLTSIHKRKNVRYTGHTSCASFIYALQHISFTYYSDFEYSYLQFNGLNSDNFKFSQ